MECDLPLWVEYLTALATPIIALIASLIGWLTWRSQNWQRKNALFERRYALFKRAEEAYIAAHTDPEWCGGMIDPIAAEARFVFDLEIARHIFESESWEVPDQVIHGVVDERFVMPFERFLRLK